MRISMRGVLAAAGLSAAAVIGIGGCDNTGINAPSDGQLIVSANPATVNIDPNQNQTTATTAIRAEIFDSKGNPLQGVPITLVTQAGQLASGGQPQNSDARGTVNDTLTLATADPASVDVTARSSALNSKVTVTKTVGKVNLPATALISAVPKNTQVSGKPVIFDGTGSLSAQNLPLTMFKWTIVSDRPDSGRANPYVVEGPTDSALTITFQNTQTLSVTLQVTDDARAPLDFSRGLPVSYSPNQAVMAYQITCGLAPTAVIAGGASQTVSGAAGTTQSVLLDGTLSTDPDGKIDKYTWTCGNGSQPIPQGNGSKAVCQYKVQSVAVQYTATLVTTDNGNGTIDPNTGTYFCAQQSPEASQTINVTPLQ